MYFCARLVEFPHCGLHLKVSNPSTCMYNPAHIYADFSCFVLPAHALQRRVSLAVDAYRHNPASVRRVLSQVGIVSVEEQRKQLFGSDVPSDQPCEPPDSARRAQQVTAEQAAAGEAAAAPEPKKRL